MTLNLTGAGLGGNREYAAVDDDPADVSAAEAVFAADEPARPSGAPGGRLVTSPDASRSDLHLPDRRRARSARVETEELADPGVVSALMTARERGVALTWCGRAPPPRIGVRDAGGGRRHGARGEHPDHPRQGRRRGRARRLPRVGEPVRRPRSMVTARSDCGSTTWRCGARRRDSRGRRRPRLSP